MNRLFSLDGKLFHILSRIADLILLNVLWLLSSLPIITIGASTTALYYVMLKTKIPTLSEASFIHSSKTSANQLLSGCSFLLPEVQYLLITIFVLNPNLLMQSYCKHYCSSLGQLYLPLLSMSFLYWHVSIVVPGTC